MEMFTLLNAGIYIGLENVKFPVDVQGMLCEYAPDLIFISTEESIRIGARPDAFVVGGSYSFLRDEECIPCN